MSTVLAASQQHLDFTSEDTLKWPPKVLLAAQGKERLWFPTIIGNGDVQVAQKDWLCYAWLEDKMKSEWQFLVREITFEKDE